MHVCIHAYSLLRLCRDTRCKLPHKQRISAGSVWERETKFTHLFTELCHKCEGHKRWEQITDQTWGLCNVQHQQSAAVWLQRLWQLCQCVWHLTALRTSLLNLLPLCVRPPLMSYLTLTARPTDFIFTNRVQESWHFHCKIPGVLHDKNLHALLSVTVCIMHALYQHMLSVEPSSVWAWCIWKACRRCTKVREPK